MHVRAHGVLLCFEGGTLCAKLTPTLNMSRYGTNAAAKHWQLEINRSWPVKEMCMWTMGLSLYYNPRRPLNVCVRGVVVFDSMPLS